MFATLASVFGLAVVDSVNPSALVVTLYLLTTRSYAPKVLTYLATVLFAYLTIGVLLMLGLEAITTAAGELFHSPFAYGLQGVIGAVMLLYAILAPDPGGKTRARLPFTQSLSAMMLLGLTVTVLELPTALPYFAAIAIMTNADLEVSRWLAILLVYNLIFILPPLLLLGSYKVFGSRLQERFERYREKLERRSSSTWLWILGIVGFLLLRDALAYFDLFGLVSIPGST
jgi:cytochrome c biogenesis protein CcdA